MSDNRPIDTSFHHHALQIHRKRVMAALQQNKKPLVKILDTCRLDNGGILQPEWAASLDDAPPVGFAAFVPAAGASSRYIADLGSLESAIRREDPKQMQQALQDLKAAGAQRWPLPQPIKDLMRRSEVLQADENLAALKMLLEGLSPQSLLKSIRRPKALMPCTQEGLSFLEMKLKEHQSVAGIDQQIFIVPRGYTQEISNQIEAKSAIPSLVLEQGEDLSTLRFDEKGHPVLDGEGKPSLVPAGHGTLVRLFPSCRKAFPEAHSLFIRNIDNVIGLKPEAVKATKGFLASHQNTLKKIKKIRRGLSEGGSLPLAKEAADALYRQANTRQRGSVWADKGPLAVFFQVLESLFQMSPSLMEQLGYGDMPDERFLLKMYQRPVNTLGQVPNSGKDVGGTPVFAELEGVPTKLCIEVPHASKEDADQFLRNPDRATHFNPVFVAAELPEGDAYPEDNPLWLLAEKTHRNKKVFYHETVLYELLGNNRLANCIFVQIPRSLFNPHKSLKEAANHPFDHWT